MRSDKEAPDLTTGHIFMANLGDPIPESLVDITPVNTLTDTDVTRNTNTLTEQANEVMQALADAGILDGMDLPENIVRGTE